LWQKVQANCTSACRLCENPGSAPIAPPATAKQEELEAYQRAQTTCDLYETIQREAKEAKIPILNLNRFQALTGMND
jgi:hypothetical protein